jgi:hypothetical protein
MAVEVARTGGLGVVRKNETWPAGFIFTGGYGVMTSGARQKANFWLVGSSTDT